ncbi:MAG: hypothetical protein LBJ72_08350 [Dysgonamonadaceae bacterium]|jgi:hypothetical protein|nr:hypothetical protein [Dysgonamonadaceae bacterium]
MKKTIHEDLVDIIKYHTPGNENAVDTLIRIIPLSKEAAYRRLRGEIPFTLSEAVRISEKLDVSLDSLVGIDKKSSFMFHIKQLFSENPFESYYDLLVASLDIYKQLHEGAEVKFYCAGNMLPPVFYFKYRALSQYIFFKWFYQSFHINGTNTGFKDVVIPEKVLSMQQKIYSEAIQIETYFIIGEDLISSLIFDIRYFASIDLISPEEILRLKDDLFCLLDDLERITTNAHFVTTGAKAFIYLSNAYFDGNYSYMTSSNYKVSSIYLYGINHLNCIDATIYESHKLWMESLIAHSTLISGSGKLHATDFFSHQRELLNTIEM